MKHKHHHKREPWFLMSLLLLFGIVFLLGILSLRRGIALFGILPDYEIEDWIIAILSFLAIIRVFIETIRI